MNKCQFAYDKNDEWCKDCNGIEFEVNGEMVQSIECKGFEPCEENTDSEPTENSKKPTEIKTERIQVINMPIEEKPIEKQQENEQKQIDNIDNYESKAKVVKICYASSITVEIEKYKKFFKFQAMEEWEMNPDCDVEKERDKLWKHLHNEVDKQVKEIL